MVTRRSKPGRGECRACLAGLATSVAGLDGVLQKDVIRSHERQRFTEAPGCQHAIEWIRMEAWPLLLVLNVRHIDGQYTECAGRKLIAESLQVKVQPSDSRFDRKLPEAGYADPDHRRGCNQAAGQRAEFRSVCHPPEQNMSVQQQVHREPKPSAMSSGSGASKSAPMAIRPRMAPGVRGASCYGIRHEPRHRCFSAGNHDFAGRLRLLRGAAKDGYWRGGW